MRGVRFLVNEEGEKTAVLIDLTSKRNRERWEDLHDADLARERENEPRESWAAVKRSLKESEAGR